MSCNYNCSECNKPIRVLPSAEKRSKTGRFFCQQSCAAQHNNRLRPAGHESRLRGGLKLKSPIPYKKRLYIRRMNQPLKDFTCRTCKLQFKSRSKKQLCSACFILWKSEHGRAMGLKSAKIQVKRSKQEIELFEMCNKHFTNVSHNIDLCSGWDADIILNNERIAVLWNGPWHYKQMPHKNHSLLQVQNRDKIKQRVLTEAGWRVLIFEDRSYTPESAFLAIRDTASCYCSTPH